MAFLSKVRAFGLYGFPVPLLPPRTPMERLRRYSFQERVRGKPRWQRALAYGTAWTTYPMLVAIVALQSAKHQAQKHAPFSRMETLRMYALALLRNVPPVEYVYYGFGDPARRALAGEYLFWTDNHCLRHLNTLRGAHNEDVQDKLRFAELCRQHSLPHVEVLAACRNGRCVMGDLSMQGATDLWVKPARANASQGAMAWTLVEGGYRSAAGEILTEPQWQQRMLQQDSIVQRRQLPHADVLALTNGAVPVLRIVTVAPGGGDAQILGAFLMLPHGAARTTTGAISCALDLQSGAVTHAAIFGSEKTHHPDTGAALVGYVVPRWDAIRDLVLRAHRDAFPRFASLGWDVALTAEGALLLETNSGWGAMDQQLHFGPLGQSAFAALLA